MSRGPDAATQLERALVANAQAANCPIAILSADCTRWASATFAGARHKLRVTAAAGPILDHWLVGLGESEFALRHYLVADLSVAQVTREGAVTTIVLEALSVEER